MKESQILFFIFQNPFLNWFLALKGKYRFLQELFLIFQTKCYAIALSNTEAISNKISWFLTNSNTVGGWVKIVQNM